MLRTFKNIFTTGASATDEAAELQQVWPKRDSVLIFTTFGRELLLKCAEVPKSDATQINIESFLKTSSDFPIKVYFQLIYYTLVCLNTCKHILSSSLVRIRVV